MEADDHQDDEIKESMSDTEDEKDVKVRARPHFRPDVNLWMGKVAGGG